jgi:ABC-type bacteriocin/lantibiotic exporter with double-glycine peptidase domain
MNDSGTMRVGLVGLLSAWLIAASAASAFPLSSQQGDESGSAGAKIWRTVANKCGINTIFLMMRLNHKAVSYEGLERGVPVTTEGTSLADIRRYLMSLGLATRIVKTTPEKLGRYALPAIAHLEEELGSTGHYVIITGLGPDWVELIDGTSAILMTQTMSEFRKRWSGYLLVVDTPSRWGWVFPTTAALGGVMTVVGVFFRTRRKACGVTPRPLMGEMA